MTEIPKSKFDAVVGDIPSIGRGKHAETLLRHARENLPFVHKTLRQVPTPQGAKAASGVVISAGPSVHRRGSIQAIKESGYAGSVIAVDGSYVACLRAGLIPDYVLTLDPHPVRMVRWFGDPRFEESAAKDDYFERQDLDVEFRRRSLERNQENIELVNKFGHLTQAVVASSAPSNVVARLREAQFETFWWNPLVDDPRQPESLTRALYAVNKLPSLNTGGSVGSAAWVFAATILKLPRVAVVGMDLGYYADTPLKQTQTYYELVNHHGSEEGIEAYFRDFIFPLTGERYYTDPTYYWYRRNLLELFSRAPSCRTFNCTEGGTLFGDHVECVRLADFLKG